MEENDIITQNHKRFLTLKLTMDMIERVVESRIQEFGISSRQAAILYVLKNATSPMIPSDIARLIFREPQTVKLTLERMEKQGLVTRVKDMPRKNQIRVALAEKGELLFQQVRGEPTGFDRIISSLSSEEWGTLTVLLEKLTRHAYEELQMIQGRRQLPSRISHWYSSESTG